MPYTAPRQPLTRTPAKPLRNEFTVVVDNREQAPFGFEGMTGKNGHPLEVTRMWCHLKSGDYSIRGLESEVAVERKSLEDLFGSLGRGRARFQREHERLQEFRFAAVVVEASWEQILEGTERSQLSPKAVWSTAMSWPIRYGVHWYALGSRRLAECATFKLLERYWANKKAGSMVV